MQAATDEVWLSQMRKGVLEVCVLSLIAREETYGYAIVEHLGGVPGLEVTESTIYPILARLSKEGMLAVRQQKSDNGPPRRYYRLTANGNHRLKSLIHTWQVVSASVACILGGNPELNKFPAEQTT